MQYIIQTKIATYYPLMTMYHSSLSVFMINKTHHCEKRHCKSTIECAANQWDNRMDIECAADQWDNRMDIECAADQWDNRMDIECAADQWDNRMDIECAADQWVLG